MEIPVEVLRGLVDVLKSGGVYAAWGLFVVLWYFERRQNVKMNKELVEIAVLKVKGDVAVERTLMGISETLKTLGYNLELISRNVIEFKNDLKSSPLLKGEYKIFALPKIGDYEEEGD